MTKRSLNNVPIVSPDDVPIGVVSTSDLLAAE
jgi:CBS domain-containing protein